MKNPAQAILLISNALTGRGFSYTKPRINGRAYRIFTKGSKIWATPYGYVYYPFVSPTTRLMSVHKQLAYSYVSSHGYAVPQTTIFKHSEPLDFTGLSTSFPLIVKPADGSGSAAVGRNIADMHQLATAIESVHSTGSDALVQRQFSGEELRLTVIDGKLVSQFLRAVPQLKGDGKRTIAELLALENQARANIVLPYVTYPQLTPELITISHDMNRIPVQNEVVRLGDNTTIGGGVSILPADGMDASYGDIAVDLANKLGAQFLVIDLLTEDYQQTATLNNYVFLEFNTAPSLRLYYAFREGAQFDIVPLLAQKIEDAL